jgi:cell wall assembly regulator SMI1
MQALKRPPADAVDHPIGGGVRPPAWADVIRLDTRVALRQVPAVATEEPVDGEAAYAEARRCIESLDAQDFGRGVTPEEVREAESQLGVRLPVSYKLFLAEFGWGGAESWAIAGLGQGVPLFLNLVTLTKSERDEAVPNLPSTLVPLLNDGAGNLECLDVSSFVGDECAVVFWDHEVGEATAIADSFGAWLRALACPSG